ncbi:hypothetical protein J7E81_10685 [Bacillus sp. ISL-18]|uniref:hypothetical protein n=1 Tax=Bacillus sp. ISL-18 TaxID=2819118 RepID=UPI001BE730E6|nr:hypothetical protein [Bacillus sp. ISL-18]MBT2655695.1 hypothetical protein [Bacillus sp. ISL-18]
MKDKYVWYASYGSNMNTDRFLCYIKGGKPEGSSKVETGCKDPSLPIDSSTFTMNFPLYFAKEAAKWESKGVAFIGLTPEPNVETYSKKYLITLEQFKGIVSQENNGLEIDLNLDEVRKDRSKIFRGNAWYGNILYLGEEKGHPIFTFTAPWDINDVEWKKPSHPYLKTIIKGLKEDYSNEEIYRYFHSKQGILGEFMDEELRSLIF